MTTLNTQGISLYYEVYGNSSHPPILLSGLGGSGKSWSTQIDRFATDYYVVVPDHRGTGRSTHARSGYTTTQLATDMASLVEHLAVGPMHVVGASTGGAIGQYMALDHPQTVRTLTMVASFARFDAFVQREFEVRRKMAAEWERPALFSGYALFLFSPNYTREHPDQVTAWIERAAAEPTGPEDREIALWRIDMIAAHDALARLGDIRQPTLVVCGDHDFCTPLPHSKKWPARSLALSWRSLRTAAIWWRTKRERRSFRSSAPLLGSTDRFREASEREAFFPPMTNALTANAFVPPFWWTHLTCLKHSS